MTVLTCNMLTITQGVIIYPINCNKKISTDLMNSIMRKYPKHCIDYVNDTPINGSILVTEITPEEFYIIGMYAEDNCGEIDPSAFLSCLKHLQYILSEYDDVLPLYVYCGTEYSNWKDIEILLDENLSDILLVKENLSNGINRFSQLDNFKHYRPKKT